MKHGIGDGIHAHGKVEEDEQEVEQLELDLVSLVEEEMNRIYNQDKGCECWYIALILADDGLTCISIIEEALDEGRYGVTSGGREIGMDLCSREMEEGGHPP